MTAWKPHSIPSLSAPCILLLAVFAQSSAFARAGTFSHDEPWNAEHINRLPPEVKNSVIHMCGMAPNAAHYFATYLADARIIKLALNISAKYIATRTAAFTRSLDS